MTNRYERMLLRVTGEIPGFQVKMKKDSLFMKIVQFLFSLLGGGSMGRFTTTIGKTMYVPNEFYLWNDEARYTLLRHEVVHVRQFRQWPMKFLDLPVLRGINFLIFSFCYLLALPLKYTLRSKFEREGYTQNMLVYHELHGEIPSLQAEKFLAQMSINFGGPAYFYMWNSQAARKWAAHTMLDISRGKITNTLDRVP